MARSPVLVVGSLNKDCFHHMKGSSIQIGGKSVDITAIKGMTLPAKSFVENPSIASQLKEVGLSCAPGDEESLALKIEGPFEQMTGGKGANAAAAAGQTFRCEFICNFGKEDSGSANEMLLADLKKYGNVDTGRSGSVDGPTGTAYILIFEDGDNAIILSGGSNMTWPVSPVVTDGSKLRRAMEECCAIMLQREVPGYVNSEVAKAARELGKPVFMDVGGTDAPLEPELMPFISVIAPNESELTFISGVDTAVGGKLKKDLLRNAVAALKNKFAAKGNSNVEVLVTLGKYGSMHFGSAWRNDGKEDIMGLLPHECACGVYALTKDSTINTTGAGDAFRGSFVAARYGEGRSLVEALRWASAAASLSVQVEGAMPSMPKRNVIEKRFNGLDTQLTTSGMTNANALEMRVTMKKPKNFYIQAARSFLNGVEAKPAADGNEAVESKQSMEALRISGLGEACHVAVAAAAEIEREGVGSICAIRTTCLSITGKTVPQIVVDLCKK